MFWEWKTWDWVLKPELWFPDTGMLVNAVCATLDTLLNAFENASMLITFSVAEIKKNLQTKAAWERGIYFGSLGVWSP